MFTSSMDDSPFGYGVSFGKADVTTQDKKYLKKSNKKMAKSPEGILDIPIAYSDFTFHKYSKVDPKLRSYHKQIGHRFFLQKRPKYFSYRANSSDSMAFGKGSTQKIAVLSPTFRVFILPCIRGIDGILGFLARIKFVYLGLILSVIVGYVLGLYYWNTSSNSFLYPTRKHLLRQINDSYVSAGHVVRPTHISKDIDVKQFTVVEKKYYTLQSGDTLLGIALAHNISIDTLISWNKISDALRIRQGKKLVIPNKDGLIHVVKSGESIAAIAKHYNINKNKILDMNDLSSLVLTPGMDLFIPGAKLDSFDRGLVLGTVFQTPLSGRIRLTSGYGYRISPITGKRMFHNGIDVTSRRSAIYSASGGIVTYVSSNNPVFGKIVIIRHARGFQTLYGHMSTISVRKGQRVSRGDVIGKVGSTGWSTGPHLHFSIIQNGSSVNPLKYIRL